MDAKAAITRLMRHTADDADPTWSPDKTRLAFASTLDGNWEIYWINADGSGLTRVTDNPALDLEPAWSPVWRSGVGTQMLTASISWSSEKSVVAVRLPDLTSWTKISEMAIS